MIPTVEHFARPPDARAVNTASLLLAGEVFDDIIDLRLISAFVGPSGTGKTFALRTLMAERAARCEFVCLDVQERATMRSIAQALYRSLTGEDAPARITRHELSYEVIELLTDVQGKPLVIALDEAQRLNTECIEYLRYLHDDSSTHFAVVLAGGDGCWEVIAAEPMLRSRVWEPTFFKPLSERALLELLPFFHAIYADVDHDLLLRINDRRCESNLRQWAGFTARALSLMDRLGEPKLTPELVQVALRDPSATTS